MKKQIRFGYGAGTLSLAFAMMASPSFAQIQPSEQNTTDESPATTSSATGEVIVVTGSRIANPNLQQSSPVAVVTDEEINLRQAVVVDDFLREIPGITPSIGANVNNGNGGSTFVDLRGIGANRNLVLLNGTRVVPEGLTGITNIDVIPTALLQRVDVLTGGAGAAYGADAISGVVNFITKTDFAGMEASATQQITEEGDGSIFRGDLTLGANFEDNRGNAVLSIGYTNRDAVFQGSRDFSQFNLSSLTGAAGGSGTTVPSALSVAGTTAGSLQVSPDGNSLVPFYAPFNFNPQNIFQLPLEQYRIYGQANYEIGDGAEVFAEGLYTQSTNRTIIASSGTFNNTLETPLSNPFLNSGIRNQICGFDTNANVAGVQRLFSQAECDAAAVATDPNDPNYRTVDLTVGRRFTEFGPRINEYETQLFQFKGGVRADLFSNMTFEAFGAYGESEVDSRQSGNGTLTRLQQSVLSTNPNTCLDDSNGCVPINLFGPAGSITPDVQAFLDVGNSGKTETSLLQGQAFVSGDFGFAIPSAITPVSVVAGVEYREYTAANVSDLLTQTPGEVLGNGAASPDVSGSYDVKEAFGELAVPILEDSFIPELTLLLGGRVSDYSTTGTEYTWKAGGTATVLPGLQIRGNYQKVTRAPNISELFAPEVTGLANFDIDPCAGAAPVNNADLRAICLAQGAPESSIGGIIADPAGQPNVTTGGNPNLAAENARTWTIGAIFQPDFFNGFSMTVDYYNITLTDAITNPTVDDVFASCFGPNFRSNPTGSATSPECTAIRRNPATGNLFGNAATTPGLPLTVTNQGRIETDGIDVVLNYRRDLGFANLNLNFAGNWTNSQSFDASQDNPDNLVFECAGFYGSNCDTLTPEFSFVQRTTLGFGGADISLLWRFIDGVDVEETANAPLDPPVNGVCEDGNLYGDGTCRPFLEDFASIGAQHYFDLTARFDVTENFDLTMAAINLFDNKPPIVGSNIGSTSFNSGNTFPSTYDPLGRRYSVTARLRF